MRKNTCELHVGRLVEVRAFGGFETTRDVEEFVQQIRGCVRRLPPGSRHVTVADWRACRVLSEAACAHMVSIFATANPSTERSALLGNPASPTANWQLLRLIAAGDNDRRRLFQSVPELLSWTSEALSDHERVRLEQFLDAPLSPARLM